ncbi:MAG: hypothetical protein AAB601_01780 [Patescibacteria group bacterium]
MKISKNPGDAEKRFKGTLAGERGGSFLEITERKLIPPLPNRVIPKAELKHGAYYRGRCRNATVARWNAAKGCFYHWQTKFGMTFIETIRHPEDESRYDAFEPFEEVPIPEREIPFKRESRR